MFKIISDETNLNSVFKKYSVIEAIQVKLNIASALDTLKIPSETLLAKMRSEGLDLEDFTYDHTTENNAEIATSVMHKHLFSLFLDEQKLIGAVANLSMAEGIAIRGVWQAMCVNLKLPSDDLLKHMEQEGMSMQRLGINKGAEKKLRAKDKLAKTQAKLANAMNGQSEIDQFKLSVAKAKLAASLSSLEKTKQNSTVKLSLAPNSPTSALHTSNNVTSIETLIHKTDHKKAL